ncbi:MoaD/ThiS family protein [Pseudomonas sp. MAFF212428]|uniref:MoaD/ThiS family protein n=1 Tax=Pseudomonas brassicae TaxID=2708063 RepID=A0A6B3NUJ0_9PSED|nr:MoaD/ThiS family protein [Pseudomonas brassicae]NER59742.1 MoaD/ThiS family protein [Pseudomonas brassicae]NER65626.1 MoaD/ThiS family protein [Pseudomonas brassicae]
MPVFINVPTLLRSYTQDSKRVEAQGHTVREVVDDLERRYPGIRPRLMDEQRLHRFVNVYLNDEDIRFLDNLDTTLTDRDELTILPAVAGGAR